VDVFANAGHPTENFEYDLQFKPGNCYAGAALFQPSKVALVQLRKRLADDPEGLEAILADPGFKMTFPDGVVTRKELGAVPDGLVSSDPVAPYLKIGRTGMLKRLAGRAFARRRSNQSTD